MLNRITVVGAGNVGATAAQRLAEKQLARTVVLVDVIEGVPQGKGLDQWEAAPIEGFDTRVVGANDYGPAAGGEVGVVTARTPPQPGLNRDAPVRTNADIAQQVARQIKQHCARALIAAASNPPARWCGGAEIVSYLKTGSAYYAPSAAVTQMVEAIVLDKKRVLPCAAWLQGEYGLSGMYCGVPCKLGRRGLEQILEVKLSPEEQAALKRSAEAVTETMGAVSLQLRPG